jgi:EAL domain-containing protein (putative c-di-GMP-specific phosphodiesterase class I)
MEDFPQDIQSVSIVSGLIGLCHNLGIRVITEGVENESQLHMLCDLKCDEIQGYLISKPLMAKDVTEFLESTQTRKLLRKIHNLPAEPNKGANNTSLEDILNVPPV